MSVLDHDFYRLVASAVLTSHEYYDNLAVEAAVLSAKHFWATNTSTPAEIVEDASKFPPVSPHTASRKNYFPLVAFIWSIMTISTLCLPLGIRSPPNATTGHRRLYILFRGINLTAFGLAIFVTRRMDLLFVYHPKALLLFCYGLLAVGLALQWFSAGYLKRVSIATYAGSLLTFVALAASFWNFESFMIILMPACVVIFARAILDSITSGH
jgi:hypothetical protein